ncbi:MAG TPA: hypothetical protein DEG71_04925 [Clostridiales bacterium]|nr:hypothetical protein [Clostridiales bacterium]
MKFEKQILGDYNKNVYKTGKHEFVTVPSQQYIEINGLKITFSADCIFIDGVEISNNNFQKLMNIYVGRRQKSKKLTKRVNEIKLEHPKKCVYDTIKLAHRQLNIK